MSDSTATIGIKYSIGYQTIDGTIHIMHRRIPSTKILEESELRKQFDIPNDSKILTVQKNEYQCVNLDPNDRLYLIEYRIPCRFDDSVSYQKYVNSVYITSPEILTRDQLTNSMANLPMGSIIDSVTLCPDGIAEISKTN